MIDKKTESPLAAGCVVGRVVGMGASAGGLDALGRLLSRLRPDARSVYIIALHMAKDIDVEVILRLLQHHSALPVTVALQNGLLVADQVFLIPPGVTGIVRAGRLKLLPTTLDQISSPSVNALFDSIANEASSSGIGVILSGAGSDGLVGCQAINAARGKILVQSLASCQMEGMPGAVIEAGLADEILLPEQIARALNTAQSPGNNRLLNNEIRRVPSKVPVSVNPAKSNSTLTREDANIFQQLLQSILTMTGCDFSCYKEETLLRRLHRRMASLKLVALLDYQIYTQKYPEELRILQHQFLISLSFFFRDGESFEALRQHLYALVKNKAKGDPIRIWVPGCASGEECYSLAMLLVDILGIHYSDYLISIVGSDLNEQALAVAERGCYSVTAFRDIPLDTLEHHFDRSGQDYTVKSHIRQVCHFQVEDVARCHVLEKVDAISCRNLLIYLKAELQDKLIKNFHDFLNQDGLLFLGQSETIGLIGNTLFAPLDHYHRVYRRKKINTK